MTQEELELMTEYTSGVYLGVLSISFDDFIESKKEPKVMTENKDDDQRETILKDISTKLDKVIELLTPPEPEYVDSRRIVIKEDKNGKRIEGKCNVDDKGIWVSVEWESGVITPIEDLKFSF